MNVVLLKKARTRERYKLYAGYVNLRCVYMEAYDLACRYSVLLALLGFRSPDSVSAVFSPLPASRSAGGDVCHSTWSSLALVRAPESAGRTRHERWRVLRVRRLEDLGRKRVRGTFGRDGVLDVPAVFARRPPAAREVWAASDERCAAPGGREKMGGVDGGMEVGGIRPCRLSAQLAVGEGG